MSIYETESVMLKTIHFRHIAGNISCNFSILQEKLALCFWFLEQHTYNSIGLRFVEQNQALEFEDCNYPPGIVQMSVWPVRPRLIEKMVTLRGWDALALCHRVVWYANAEGRLARRRRCGHMWMSACNLQQTTRITHWQCSWWLTVTAAMWLHDSWCRWQML